MGKRLKAVLKKAILETLRAWKLYRSYALIPAKEISLAELQDEAEIFCINDFAPIKRTAPVTSGNEIDPEFNHLLIDKPQSTFVLKAKGWSVWGNNGAVITAANCLFKEVSREFNKKPHTILEQFKLVKPKVITGTTAVLAASGAQLYYHWMFDILPRIKLLQDCYSINSIEHFVLTYHGLPYQKESLNFLGIDESKIVPSNGTWDFHITAETLIVPSLASKVDIASAAACKFLVDTFLYRQAKYDGTKKIYLKRTGKRRLVNEQEIENYLQSLGFETIICDPFSVREQALIFNSADIIIGPHGAAFTNAVFCKAGTKVIEFFSPRWINPCYWTICNEQDLRYYYLVGETIKADSVNDAISNNILLDINKLRRLMIENQLC